MSKYNTKFKIDGIHRNSMHYVLRDWVGKDAICPTLAIAAETLGITQKHLESVLSGAKPVSDKLAGKLGYRRVQIFKKIK